MTACCSKSLNVFSGRLCLFVLVVVIGLSGIGHCADSSTRNSFGTNDQGLKRSLNTTEIGFEIRLKSRKTLCDIIHRADNGCPRGFPCMNGQCRQEKVSSVERPLPTRRQVYCHCDLGWKGHMCHECCNKTCDNNGTCIVDVDGISFCWCTTGYSGANCEMELADTPGIDKWKLTLTLIGIFGVIFTVFVPISVLYIWKRRAVILMKISQTFHKIEDKNATIANNIIDAIQHSRRTILILSPSYIQSEWTRLEYQVAQHEMLKLRHRIVPIMFENICHVKHVDENLKLILNSVTYLVWPGKDSSKQSLFWKALRKALPRERIKADDSFGCQDGENFTADISNSCDSLVSFPTDLNKDVSELPMKVTCI